MGIRLNIPLPGPFSYSPSGRGPSASQARAALKAAQAANAASRGPARLMRAQAALDHARTRQAKAFKKGKDTSSWDRVVARLEEELKNLLDGG